MTKRRTAAAIIDVMARLRRGPGGMRTPMADMTRPTTVNDTDNHSFSIRVSQPRTVSTTPIKTSRRRPSCVFCLGCVVSNCSLPGSSSCRVFVVVSISDAGDVLKSLSCKKNVIVTAFRRSTPTLRLCAIRNKHRNLLSVTIQR